MAEGREEVLVRREVLVHIEVKGCCLTVLIEMKDSLRRTERQDLLGSESQALTRRSRMLSVDIAEEK